MPLIASAPIISLDDGTVLLTNAITANELLKRWPGIAEFELAELMDKNILQGYSIVVPLQGNNGGTHYRCRLGGSCTRASHDDYIWHDTCFNVEDVEQIETTRWYYKRNRPADGESSPQNASEWISCDTLANRWGWSPFDVVKFLNSGAIPFNNYWNHTPYVDGLHEFSVHQVDLLRWEAENAGKICNALVLAKDGERLREENKAFADKVKELETQNAALRSEIEAPKAASTGPPPQLEDAKATNTRERWKGYMRTGLTLAVHVIGVGRKFTTKELEQECSRLGCPALTEEAMQIFREAMPLECVHTGGRPKGITSE